jgi:opacity protein-like surface antigen
MSNGFFRKIIFSIAVTCTPLVAGSSASAEPDDSDTNVPPVFERYLQGSSDPAAPVDLTAINENSQPNLLAQSRSTIQGVTSAPVSRYDIGIGAQFGSSTAIGLQGRIGVSDNISIRPSILFGGKSRIEAGGNEIESTTAGTTVGLAATYDFRLDPQARSVGYVGLSSQLVSSSGTPAIFVPLIGGFPATNAKIEETKVGIVAGADYALSDNFTVGANVTYNFARNLTVEGSRVDVTPGGSNMDFGIRAAYRF